MREERTAPRRRATALAAAAATVAALAILAGACGGGDSTSSKGSTGADSSSVKGAGTDNEGTPRRGGKVTYGLEAETSGGFCLPDAQLAISGIMVARAVYDTLTIPTADGFKGYLAESVTPNADYTQWTIKLRDGVEFHDGSPLTAQVVKNNIDADLGRYPGRNGLLGRFVFANIDTVTVTDPMTVTVTTKVPWPALPAYLYGGGRFGIIAQSQLDDPNTCDTKLVGTGPFKLDEWVVNDHLTVSRNPNYWAKDAQGRQLPYLDGIEFRPSPDSDARVNSLASGQYDIVHATGAESIKALEAERNDGNINLIQSLDNAEVEYMMFNTTKPPFDNQVAREAVATALDRKLYNKVRNLDTSPLASGGYPEGTPGHLPDAGFPGFDRNKARALAAQYEKETGQPLEFTYVFSGDAGSIATAQFVQEQMKAAGITMKLRQLEQAALINTALGNDWQLMPFRNFPGGVPDTNYVWWYGGSPVNFGKFDDPKVNELLDRGRGEADTAQQQATYGELNRQLNRQVYFVWLNNTEWNIGSSPEVHGIMGPELPGGILPAKGLATGHPLTGIWVDQ